MKQAKNTTGSDRSAVETPSRNGCPNNALRTAMLRVATTMKTSANGRRRVRQSTRNPATATYGSMTGVAIHHALYASPVSPTRNAPIAAGLKT
jgi:hypothetical protein